MTFETCDTLEGLPPQYIQVALQLVLVNSSHLGYMKQRWVLARQKGLISPHLQSVGWTIQFSSLVWIEGPVQGLPPFSATGLVQDRSLYIPLLVPQLTGHFHSLHVVYPPFCSSVFKRNKVNHSFWQGDQHCTVGCWVLLQPIRKSFFLMFSDKRHGHKWGNTFINGSMQMLLYWLRWCMLRFPIRDKI